MAKSLRIRLDNDLHRRAKIKAAETGIPMAEICRRALLEWVRSSPGQGEDYDHQSHRMK